MEYVERITWLVLTIVHESSRSIFRVPCAQPPRVCMEYVERITWLVLTVNFCQCCAHNYTDEECYS